MARARNETPVNTLFAKTPTGIQGLDEITQGGLPSGRPTLVCGGAGCGKTILAIEFLVRGAQRYNEPGVFMSFEETAEELIQNVRSMGFDLKTLVRRKKLVMSYVRVERSEIEETGEYDLEGLFIRLAHAIDSIGAKRVVLDTIESLFSGLTNTAILRAELRRLFLWLKEKGVTAIVTGERGDNTLTRQGLEEYVSDCVIVLDHRVDEQLSTRRMRVVKYRGTKHGTNEYPLLIDEKGMDVLPITSLGLSYKVSTERVSSGVPELDAMLGGGFFRGSSILLSGTAGTGKTTTCASFLDAACRRGERSAYFSFEESMDQTVRNMRSVGMDLKRWTKKGLLYSHAARPTLYGLETHLVTMFRTFRDYKPRNVVLDPITSFMNVGHIQDVRSLLMRLLDYLKAEGITAYFTTLTSSGGTLDESSVAISSMIDTWLMLRDIESNGERNRGLYILKSRGMAHSNQIREFVLTNRGIQLRDTYLGPAGVLTGSARLALEARDTAEAVARKQEIASKQFELVRERALTEARISAIKTEFEAKVNNLKRDVARAQAIDTQFAEDRTKMAAGRKANKPRNSDVSRAKKRG